MRGGLIIWDAAKLDRLHDAIKACQSGETPEVRYADEVQTWSREAKVTHSWPLMEATSIYMQVRAALLSSPARRYYENREGDEP